MTTENWIDIVGHTATWVSVLIVYFTLKEMSSQRKQSYKPYIILLQKSFYGYYRKYGEYLIPALWTNSELNKEQIIRIERPETHEVYIKAINLGLGAAKEIEWKWNCDFEKVTDELNDIYQKNSVQIKLDLTSSGWLRVDIANSLSYSMNVVNTLESSFDYLSPVSIDNERLRLQIPMPIRSAINHWMHAWWYCREVDGLIIRNEMNLEDFDLIINYKDIADEVHIIRFKVKIHIFVMTEPHEESGQAFYIQLELESVDRSDAQHKVFGFHQQ